MGLVTSLPWRKPPERAAGRLGAGGESLGKHLVNVAVAQDARVLCLRWADVMAVEHLTKVYSLPLYPTPYILHPTPYILHPTPYTLHSTPYTLHPTPLHPTPRRARI